MAMVGETAPEWSATAYLQGKRVAISHRDFTDSWHIIYWWPFSFTGICNSEIHGFQSMYERFMNINVNLIGISCDSFFVHEQWFKSGSFNSGNRPTHPIISDTTREMTKAFGFYNETGGCAYRATVLIAPDREIKSLTVNHLPVARDPRDIFVTAQAFLSNKGCSLPVRLRLGF